MSTFKTIADRGDLRMKIEALKTLRAAVVDVVKEYDPETGMIDVTPEPGCQQCTGGATPAQFDTGPCAYHRLLAAIAVTAPQGE